MRERLELRIPGLVRLPLARVRRRRELADGGGDRDDASPTLNLGLWTLDFGLASPPDQKLRQNYFQGRLDTAEIILEIRPRNA